MDLAAESVAAVVPCHREPPATDLLEALAARLGHVVVVCDGLPAPAARRLRPAAAEVIRLPRCRGKGHALAAGIAALRARGVEAVLTLDADGQHPVEPIGSFLAAAERAELVVGDRFAGGGEMPRVRRLANRSSRRLLSAVARHPVPDAQCGMRLLRGRALHDVRFSGGRMEAETRHLKRCLVAGVPVAWVPIPAIYAGEPSAYRPVRDSLAILQATVGA